MEQNQHVYRGVRVLEYSTLSRAYAQGWRVEVDGRPLPGSVLPPRPAPRGWQWGYEASAPLKLSHMILAHEWGQQAADALYAALAHDILAERLGSAGVDGWTLSSQELADWRNTHRLLRSVLDPLEED
jgi:hypothetical protein